VAVRLISLRFDRLRRRDIARLLRQGMASVGQEGIIDSLVATVGLLISGTPAISIPALSVIGSAAADAEEPEQAAGEREGDGEPGDGEEGGVEGGRNAVLVEGRDGADDHGGGDGGQDGGRDHRDGREAGYQEGAAAADAGAESEEANDELEEGENAGDDVDDFGPLDDGAEGLDGVDEGGVGEGGAVFGGQGGQSGGDIGRISGPVELGMFTGRDFALDIAVVPERDGVGIVEIEVSSCDVDRGGSCCFFC